jgi:hypothetical protein
LADTAIRVKDSDEITDFLDVIENPIAFVIGFFVIGHMLVVD